MLVTPLPIVILDNSVHCIKAYSPMVVTLSGIVTLVSLLQFMKAYAFMFDTSFKSSAVISVRVPSAYWVSLFSVAIVAVPAAFVLPIIYHSPLLL